VRICDEPAETAFPTLTLPLLNDLAAMNYPAASNGVSSGNYYRPKGRGIKPLSAEGGLKISPISQQHPIFVFFSFVLPQYFIHKILELLFVYCYFINYSLYNITLIK